MEEKNYLHEHTIDVRALLSPAFCDDPCVNHHPAAPKMTQHSEATIDKTNFMKIE